MDRLKPALPQLLRACALLLLVVLFAAQPASRPQALLRDFNAFYCAGWTIAHHADPYRNEPLGKCERTLPRPAFLEHAPPSLTVPAPLPGYALAPFALLALLPYGAAALIWTVLLLASFALSVSRLRALTSLPLSTITAALALSDAYVGITLGQIAPLALAAVVNAAWAAAQGRLREAAASAALAMLEPHLGLPACLALAIFHPRSIGWLSAGGALSAALSLGLLGLHESLEYATRVVGAHALSEVFNVKQLSLTALLARLGVDAPNAVRIGALWYTAMLAAGLLAARSLTRETGRTALTILLPVAFAMIGGTFVHIAQIAAVIPAVLVLLDARPGDRVLTLALLALAVPWVQFETLGTSFPFLAALVTGILAAQLCPSRLTWKMLPPLLAFLLAWAPAQMVQPLAYPSALLAAHYDPQALAQTTWGTFVRALGTKNLPAYDAARFPTVFGLLAFAWTSCRQRRDVLKIGSEQHC